MQISTFVQTKPKVFYNIVSLVDKLNSANKNISKYYRVTILEPIILDNMVNSLKEITKISSNQTNNDNYTILSTCIADIEIAREFFLFFASKKDVNYSENFKLQVALEYEQISKQLNGWKKKFN